MPVDVLVRIMDIGTPNANITLGEGGIEVQCYGGRDRAKLSATVSSTSLSANGRCSRTPSIRAPGRTNQMDEPSARALSAIGKIGRLIPSQCVGNYGVGTHPELSGGAQRPLGLTTRVLCAPDS